MPLSVGSFSRRARRASSEQSTPANPAIMRSPQRRSDELLAEPLPRVAAAERHLYRQPLVNVVDADLLDLDHVREPPLERPLDEELRRCAQDIAVRHEHELQKAATEVRAVHAFPGCREEHLLDEVAHVVVGIGRGTASTLIDVKWEVHVIAHQVACTWVWTPLTLALPCGA